MPNSNYQRKFYTGKKVAVIGSAPSVDDIGSCELGRYDTVVRCNGGAIAGRTDVLYAGRLYWKTYKKDITPLNRIKLLVARSTRAKQRWQKDKNKPALRVNIPKVALSENTVNFIDSKVEALHDSMVSTGKVGASSTGLRAIMDVLDSNPAEVFIAGFTFYRTPWDLKPMIPRTRVEKKNLHMRGYGIEKNNNYNNWRAEEACLAGEIENHREIDIKLDSDLKKIMAIYPGGKLPASMRRATYRVLDSGDRYIVTIATKECEEGVNRLVKSLRRVGYNDIVHVFYPDVNEPPVINDNNIKFVKKTAWWKHYPSPFGGAYNHNVPAMLKPDLFEHFEDGDSVLYVDGGDIMFFQHPNFLFKESVQILHLCKCGMKIPAPKSPTVRSFLKGINLSAEQRYNSGVILAKIQPQTRTAFWLWKSFLYFALVENAWTIGHKRSRGVIGDQPALNTVIAIMKKNNLFSVGKLSSWWNVRGEKMVQEIRVSNGKVITGENRQVGILHASGGRDVAREILNLLETEKNEIHA